MPFFSLGAPNPGGFGFRGTLPPVATDWSGASASLAITDILDDGGTFRGIRLYRPPTANWAWADIPWNGGSVRTLAQPGPTSRYGVNFHGLSFRDSATGEWLGFFLQGQKVEIAYGVNQTLSGEVVIMDTYPTLAGHRFHGWDVDSSGATPVVSTDGFLWKRYADSVLFRTLWITAFPTAAGHRPDRWGFLMSSDPTTGLGYSVSVASMVET